MLLLVWGKRSMVVAHKLNLGKHSQISQSYMHLFNLSLAEDTEQIHHGIPENNYNYSTYTPED